MKTVLIIPVLNEEGIIGPVLEAIPSDYSGWTMDPLMGPHMKRIQQELR